MRVYTAENGFRPELSFVDVPPDRVSEAEFLTHTMQVYYMRRDAPERIAQTWPGHISGTPVEYDFGSELEIPASVAFQRFHPSLLYPHPLTGAEYTSTRVNARVENDPEESPREERIELVNDENNNNYPELTINLAEDFMERNLLPPFKIDYETYEEAVMRLQQTVILLGNTPYFVYRVNNVRNKNWKLILEDVNNERRVLAISKLKNTRSARPGYVTYEGRVAYLIRRPARVYQQGLTHANTLLFPVGQPPAAGFEIPTKHLLETLAYRKLKPFNPSMVSDLLDRTTNAFRLSNVIAIYRRKQDVWVEYKGRSIAQLEENKIKLDERDKSLPWLQNELREVNIQSI
jgi:hypothetical protein